MKLTQMKLDKFVGPSALIATLLYFSIPFLFYEFLDADVDSAPSYSNRGSIYIPPGMCLFLIGINSIVAVFLLGLKTKVSIRFAKSTLGAALFFPVFLTLFYLLVFSVTEGREGVASSVVAGITASIYFIYFLPMALLLSIFIGAPVGMWFASTLVFLKIGITHKISVKTKLTKFMVGAIVGGLVGLVLYTIASLEAIHETLSFHERLDSKTAETFTDLFLREISMGQDFAVYFFPVTLTGALFTPIVWRLIFCEEQQEKIGKGSGPSSQVL